MAASRQDGHQMKFGVNNMNTLSQGQPPCNRELWIDQFWDGKPPAPRQDRIVYRFLIEKESEGLIWKDIDLEEIWLAESYINESTERALRGGSPIVCRPDMISDHIELTRHNAQVLSYLPAALFECVIRHGLQGYDQPDLKITFEVSKKEREWKLTIMNPITKIQFIGRTALWPPIEDYKSKWRTRFSFPVDRTPHFIFEDDRGKWPPEQLMRLCFPTWEEIQAAEHNGIRFYSLAEIRITNRLKVYYHEYLMDVLDTLDVLESFLTLEPWKLEIALDCIDESKSRALRQFASLKWDTCEFVYHFRKGSRQPIPGPIPGGESEYSRYRPKARYDKRPNSERPEHGTRQHYTYSRKQKWGELRWIVYRLEMSLYRDYLRPFMRGGKSMRALIFCIPYLALWHLNFMELDLQALFRDFKLPRNLKNALRESDIRGQIYLLRHARREYGLFLPFDAVKPYMRKLPRPDILFLRHPWLDPACDKINSLELVPGQRHY